jgi:dUTP pyrophosphatase|tara:strand:+ start:383 stop:550 length:168 start_codon:yes stop_codon:yes gene_type:complete
MVPLMNYSKETYTVTKHERIAQLVAITTENLEFHEVDNLDDSERSDGGFGSTGKN